MNTATPFIAIQAMAQYLTSTLASTAPWRISDKCPYIELPTDVHLEFYMLALLAMLPLLPINCNYMRSSPVGTGAGPTEMAISSTPGSPAPGGSSTSTLAYIWHKSTTCTSKVLYRCEIAFGETRTIRLHNAGFTSTSTKQINHLCSSIMPY